MADCLARCFQDAEKKSPLEYTSPNFAACVQRLRNAFCIEAAPNGLIWQTHGKHFLLLDFLQHLSIKGVLFWGKEALETGRGTSHIHIPVILMMQFVTIAVFVARVVRRLFPAGAQLSKMQNVHERRPHFCSVQRGTQCIENLPQSEHFYDLSHL